MTEEQWNHSHRPDKMLLWLVESEATLRKLRLCAVACCSRILPVLDVRCREAVGIAERLADNDSVQQEAKLAEASMMEVRSDVVPERHKQYAARFLLSSRPNYVIRSVHHVAVCQANAKREEREVQCRLIRCVFGTLLFRPITLPPFLLTSRVVRLAQVIYDGRHFGDMPVLGDALEEAGCDNQEVLSHCRSGEGHVRGCWVVDLILGRA